MAAIVAAIKILELAIDHQAIFFIDSGAYLLNAVSLHFDHATRRLVSAYFNTYRSYIYSWIVRLVAAPFHGFLPVVLLQMLLGGVTAWLTGLMLIRYFRVRPSIALAAATVFALDPVQLVHERLVLPETVALFATALFLMLALEFLESRGLPLLIGLALVGVFLVSLRIVYLPLVVVMAVLVPCGGLVVAQHRAGERGAQGLRRNLPMLAAALCVSLAATAIAQQGFRRMTGYFAHREPGYNYESGSFLLANVSPLVIPADATDPRVQQVIAAQQAGKAPLTYANRQTQLWGADGLIARLLVVYGKDERGFDQACNAVAKHAIRRDPIGFLALGLRTYGDYWTGLPQLALILRFENGTNIVTPFSDDLVGRIGVKFGGFDIRRLDAVATPARRYHEALALWNVVLLLTWPFLLGIALGSRPANFVGVALLFCWSGMLLGATCLGSVMVYRYLQPFSLPGIVAGALVVERLLRHRSTAVAMA